MGFYRQTFPDATITVKLHMLEDHMVLFLQQWKGVGFGLLGEQGAEGIHADFNNLKRRFSGIPDSVERLRCVMKEHHLRCCPRNIAARPPTSKTAKREEWITDCTSLNPLSLSYTMYQMCTNTWQPNYTEKNLTITAPMAESQTASGPSLTRRTLQIKLQVSRYSDKYIGTALHMFQRVKLASFVVEKRSKHEPLPRGLNDLAPPSGCTYLRLVSY